MQQFHLLLAAHDVDQWNAIRAANLYQHLAQLTGSSELPT